MTTQQDKFDLLVIGAGSAGVRAARRAAQYGAKVGIIEAQYLGGTCVNVGCVPKKLFVYAAHFAEEFAIARHFGWQLPPPTFVWSKLLANKDAEIKRLHTVYAQLLQNAGVHTLMGQAVLLDRQHVQIGESVYQSKNIIIATGSCARHGQFPGAEHVVYSDAMFSLPALPKRALIIGGGYIAVEFAGILHGLGVETQLVYRNKLFLRGFDSEVCEHLAASMQEKGIKLLFNETIVRVDKQATGMSVTLTSGAHIDCDLVLAAIGRIPNTHGLGLAECGVAIDTDGAIKVDANYQSSVPGIYAIGDVSNKHNLTPVAIAEADYLAAMLYADSIDPVDYTNIPTCVFSQPSMACVGISEQEAREQWPIDVYKAHFRPLQLSLTDSTEKIFMKMIVRRDNDQVIGVYILGADAAEIIQVVAVAMRAGVTKSVFDATLGLHPSTAEELLTLRMPASGKVAC